MAIIIKKKARTPAPEPLVEPEKTKKSAPGRLLDAECRHVTSKFPNALVSWWLIASYTYYIHDTPLISDGLYDEVAKQLLARWDEIQHPHKKLITVDNLKTGSLYNLRPRDYPTMVKGAASHLAKSTWGVTFPLV